MLKCIKYFLNIDGQYVGGVFAISTGWVFAQYFLFGANPSNSDVTSGMMLGIALMLSFSVAMTRFSYYSDVSVAMGAKRIDFFIASQIMKIISTTCFVAEMFFVYWLMEKLYQRPLEVSGNIEFVVILPLCILLATLGDTTGIVCTRFGRIGMIIYMVVCMVFGASIGLSVSLGGDKVLTLIGNILSNQTAVIGVTLVAAVVVSIINYFMHKKIVVRG